MPKFLKIESSDKKPVSRRERHADIAARMGKPDSAIIKKVRAAILDEGEDSIPWDDVADLLDLLDQARDDATFLLAEYLEIRRQRDDENIPKLRRWQSVAWKLAGALQQISTLTDNPHDRGRARAALAENGFPVAYSDEWKAGLREELADRHAGEEVAVESEDGIQREWVLSQEAFEKFLAMLDEPAKVSRGLIRLMNTDSPFDDAPTAVETSCQKFRMVRGEKIACTLDADHGGSHEGRDETEPELVISWKDAEPDEAAAG